MFEKLLNLKENKTFICIILFLSYTFGLCAFYHHETFLIGAIFSTSMAALLTFILLKPEFQKVISPVFILILYLLFMGGYFNAKVHYKNFDDFSNIFYQKEMEITGIIKEIPKYNSASNNYKFVFLTDSANVKNKTYEISNTNILVTVKNENGTAKNLKYGDKLTLKGRLTTPNGANNPSQFDYAEFLKMKGVLKTFYTTDLEIKNLFPPKLSEIKNKNDKISYFFLCFMRKMNDLRDNVIEKHSKYVKSPRLEILGGVVFGDDAVNPPDEVKESFVNSGLLHLLAASGLNVALILSMWLCVLYFVNINYRIKVLSGIFIVILYTVMTGFPPSIVRASVMFILMLIGKLMFREVNGISLIFMAGLIILFFKPEFLNNVGFQLSFLVTIGLMVCIPSICHLLSTKEKNFIKKIENYPKILKSIMLILSPTSLVCCIFIPVVAQLWAGPLQAYYFNTFSTYSILANIAVIPFIGLVSFLGFISTAFCFIPKVSDFIIPVFDFILNFLIQIILNISNFFASLDYSMVKTPSPSFLQIFIFYAFVIFLFVSLKFLFKKKILNVCALICLIFLGFTFIDFDKKQSEVIFFSVGNGDSCLIKSKDDKYILIDTGRYVYTGLSSAKTILLEYFYDKNIKEIDTVIVSHYDSDHSGGLVDILKNVKVDNLIILKPDCTSKNSCEIKDYIKENNVKYYLPENKKKILAGENLEFVNILPKGAGKNNKNDSSIITLINLEGYKFLFMGDVSAPAYHSVEDFIPDNIDVLKSSHHGAKNTVDDVMLNKLKPKYSIISTGINPYGHPDSWTVAKLNKYGKTLSTKELGAIKFKITENGLRIYTFNSNKKRFVEQKL